MATISKFEDAHRDECSRILYALPQWFGIEDANRAYIAALGELPTAVAKIEDDIVGFVALREHNPASVEIHVLAVAPHLHNRAVGTALVTWARDWCRARGVHWLHVKTRGPSTPDPDYEKTRAFYLAKGFEPLFESLTEWGPQDAALVLVEKLSG